MPREREVSQAQYFRLPNSSTTVSSASRPHLEKQNVQMQPRYLGNGQTTSQRHNGYDALPGLLLVPGQKVP
jgi:hypothetical protein